MAQVKAALVPIVVSLAPFVWRPERLAHPAPWILVVGMLVIYLYHPPIPRLSELARDAGDKRSAVYILLSATLASFAPVVEFVARDWFGPEVLSWWLVSGVVLVLAGIVVRVWAVRELGRFFTATVRVVDDQTVVRSGPYRFIRHPSYLGVLLGFFGNAVLFQSGWAAAVTLLLVFPAYLYRIRVEETAMSAKLGPAYADYQAHSRRIIPFLY